MKTIKRKVWLVVGGKKSSYSTSINELTLPKIFSGQKTPSTKGNEIAIALTIELPQALFVDPSFSATISVPGELWITRNIGAPS